MQIVCIATCELQTGAGGEVYANFTTVHPTPGIRFGFEGANGDAAPKAGMYRVNGILSRFDGVGKNNKPYTQLRVKGELKAVPLDIGALYK